MLKDSTFQQQWAQHLVSQWGNAASGGVRYYIFDNEHSIWYITHRDVKPTGPRMQEIRDLFIDYGTKIKAADPGAQIVGPEEWGWSAYFESGFDSSEGGTADRQANGGADYMPWLLSQLHQHEVSTGQKVLDIFTVHYYPQGGEYGNDTSTAMQQRRNRSTRSLWDPSYVDQTWINDKVRLVPRLKEWVATNYPGLRTGITEYSWGAESHINGATTQADILGIFGREGLDLATRWVTPPTSSVTFKSYQMYRNYDGNRSTFGDVSVSATTTLNPDNTAVFAGQRSSDGALTLMVINKVTSAATASVNLSGFTAGGPAQVYQLTSTNAITHLADVAVNGGTLPVNVPAQSITLYVVPSASGPTLSVGDATVTEGNSGSTSASFAVTLSQASAGTVTVGYSTVNGTATAGSDYTATSGTLTFTAGQTTKTVTVPVTGDTVVEPNETFYLSLATPTGATILDGQGTGTITNDDTAAASSLSIGNATVTEGNSGSTNAVFTVTLAPAASQTVTVNYATANGTATAGSDYTATSGALTFTAGQTSKTVTVAVQGDTAVEPNETFVVNLSGAVGASLADAQGAGTITNDDSAATGLPVVWTNAAGVTVAGNTLTKTAANGWGNAGAVSTQALPSGDGAVEITANSTTGYRMFGLSQGSATNAYQEIDFALYLANGGNLVVIENGAIRGSAGSYVAGDKLRVIVQSGVVKYVRNGIVLYASTVAPSYPLLVDTAFYDTGAVLSSALLYGTWTTAPATTTPVAWTGAVGVAVSSNNLTKTGAVGWNAAAVSTLSLPAGTGAVETTVNDTTHYRMFGLGNGSTTTSYQEIDFAFYLMTGGSLRIYENGVYRGEFGTYAAGDKLRVAVGAGLVRYYRNGALLYTSTVAPTYPLIVDTSFYDTGGTLNNVMLGGTWQ